MSNQKTLKQRIQEFRKKASCEHIDGTFCNLYKSECHHDDESPTDDCSRCYRLVPREDSELAEWMDPINCATCNEALCVECDIYIGFKHEYAYLEDNRQAYDALAAEYKKRSKNKSRHEESLDVLVGETLKFAMQRFNYVDALEIGPGSGEVCAYLAERGCKTTAMDFSQNILDVVKKTSPKTKLVKAEVHAHDFSQEKYNLIYCGALIHLFTKQHAEEVLESLHSTLADNGILFMNTTIHEESSEGFYTKADYAHAVARFRHRYTEEEFKDMIESAGFRILQRIFTDEKDRKKKWVAYISEKV
ncbi:class I SAM-dependent methyltransferase [Candidatus Woesearchaeota archaeon]|nr:class I SAM-dependent methyltransferase [Candidatus Woesearchaeota archaeon]